MQPANEPNRKDVLVKLIAQLQRDHDLAVKAENIGAAVTASKAIADLLSVKEETSKANNTNPLDGMTDAELEFRIRQLDASLRAHGYLLDGTDEGQHEEAEARRSDDTELAARILALLEDKP